MIPARHPSKLDIEPVACSVSLCGKLATIIHGEKAYCGEHALKQLNAGARLKDIPVGDPGQRPRSNQPCSEIHELSEPNAVKALLEIAAALDEEADKLERDVVTKLPLNDS